MHQNKHSFINKYKAYLQLKTGKTLFSKLIFLSVLLLPCCKPDFPDKELSAYREELKLLADEFGGTKDMPDVDFFLLGMGNREKLIYKNGVLRNLITGDTIREWEVTECKIIPSIYTVLLSLKGGSGVAIYENEDGVWLEENGKKVLIEGTSSHVFLPDFKEYKYGRVLKVLNQEILINILDGRPLPNFLVYKNPWRRDGAMMAMCLKNTGNIDLIKDWVNSLTDPYDRNNAGETEADNLGQTLYLLSLFSGKSSPLAGEIMNEAKRFEVNSPEGIYIKGRSDFHETPVYQTKWLKFGLKSLGLPDKYIIPAVNDNYSALFWWDYTDYYTPGTHDAEDRNNYPYLGWACDHFHKTKKSPISNRLYPLTWEINASQAVYSGMIPIDTVYTSGKIASPHTWHASEIFLYLLELKK